MELSSRLIPETKFSLADQNNEHDEYDDEGGLARDRRRVLRAG